MGKYRKTQVNLGIHMYISVNICGIAGENRPTGAKFPMEIIDL